MRYAVSGHGFLYEIQAISQIFFPNEKFLPAETIPERGIMVESVLAGTRAVTRIYSDGCLRASETRYAGGRGDGVKRGVCASLYRALAGLTGQTSPWGMLTGVKPTKIVNSLAARGLTDDETVAYMNRMYFTDETKARLCVTAARFGRELALSNTDAAASLYIGVPFCRSRCLYCSFTSYELKKYNARKYLEALSREMAAAAPFFYGKQLDAVYMGGGTPTALNEEDFAALLQMAGEHFDIKNAREYTVEAGRPDTFTRGKLTTMLKTGVTRISINPQTADDATLKAIGRDHTAAEFIEAFHLARAEGFTNINADIIMGLPGETPRHATATMDMLAELSPEGVTVHTLAVKRASRLKDELYGHNLPSAADVEGMLGIARTRLAEMGMAPYYLYRQKNTAGNFENAGYAKGGCACVYNAQIIEEKQTIIALGAGAVSKLYHRAQDRIERIFNPKPPDEYIKRIDEIAERKKNI